MKLIISILFLLAFVEHGNATKIRESVSGINTCWISKSSDLNTKITFDYGIIDEQDSNDFNGPDFFVINPVPGINPIQYRVKTILVVLPATINISLNLLLIDLPPPSFSL